MKLETNHVLLLALTHISQEVFPDDNHSKGVKSSPREDVSSICRMPRAYRCSCGLSSIFRAATRKGHIQCVVYDQFKLL